ncbi:hypothetical protein HYT57_05390 [Candidatus Woesearchaeota archaeon]|nr:hypothetical protein [Candidatus Woesearchaeota archaeon]
MDGLPKPIERTELGRAALDERMTQDYGFFSLVARGILEARGFELREQASVYYHVDDLVPGYNGNNSPILPAGLEGFFEEGMGQILKLRLSLAERFARRKESHGVLAESVFTNISEYRKRTNFQPIIRSLVGNLGVHTRHVVHSGELKKYVENGQHPAERVLGMGCIIQTPTRYGELHIMGLGPIQDLAKQVSEKLA